jgi:uncharacterized membrane protein (UPF0182 family)
MRLWNRASQFIVILLGLWFGFDLLSHFVVESLWFQEVNYQSVFWFRLGTQAAIWTIVTVVSIVFLLINLSLAQRLKSHSSLLTPSSSPPPNSLPWLLPLTFGMSFLLGLLLLHYGRAITTFWQIDWTVPNITPALPMRFRLGAIVQSLIQLMSSIQDGWMASVELLLLVGGAIALLIYPRFLLKAGAVVLSLSLGFTLSHYWGNFLQLFHATAFNRTDPFFNRDISFYVFFLPVIELFEFWLIGLFTYGFTSVYLSYLLADNNLSEGRVLKFSVQQQRHLAGLGGCWMMAIALTHWISRYELLYSTRGVSYGASYTDATVQLPANTVLSIGALAISLYLFYQTRSKYKIQDARIFSGYLMAVVVVGFVLPIAVQRLAVQPNELARERPYIERSIAKTREAFNLTAIDVQTFNPQNNLTSADLQKNSLTVQNIRLWDTRPLLETNRQLQQIRPYYRFFDADIDRYTLPTSQNSSAKQQVLIAARELDYNNVPAEAKTWVNEHLVYTHGYGFTVSPVNKVAAGGLPDYLVRDIGANANQGGSALGLANDRVQDSIPIANPRIYYGEIANTYVMTSTKVSEFDYPSGNENAYTVYEGQGGISMRSFWQKLAFSKVLNDWQMLFTRDFTPDTKLLFRRNINQRIRSIAPFLKFDQDPYLVVADAGNPAQSLTQNYLYWIVDAYTTSDHYPYSDPGQLGFNYIRNSIKVVIDAYNGSVNFYIADPQDPMIQTWAAIFPNLFKPLDAMPAALRNHLRYPADLFNGQSDRLITYHMTDPQVFYNREDQWQVPNEIYGNKEQPVEPYYLITNLPTTVSSEEFILLLPYTPNQRTNLIAWLAARSDGQNYGKLLLYTFPKQELVFGTEQIEARINQDPVISQQISLWNRAGSRAIQGNLLVIPIEQSLLYVEPLYLEAEQNSLPTLVRVIVAYENRIAMAATLDEALKAVFQSKPPTTPAIVRPVE